MTIVPARLIRVMPDNHHTSRERPANDERNMGRRYCFTVVLKRLSELTCIGRLKL